MQDTPIVKEILLVGGGHTHALFLNMWSMNTIPGVRVTLVSPQVMTPYSGMLPGLVAGYYQFEETHIDLVKLCRFAKARFIQSRACGLEPQHKRLKLEQRPSVHYDVISFDTGITPDLSVKGASAFTTPVKPIDQFYSQWSSLIQQLERSPTDGSKTNKTETSTTATKRITVVGNGAGGVELILAMQHRLNCFSSSEKIQFQLIARGQQIIAGYPKRFQSKLHQLIQDKKITFIPNFEVNQITKNEIISTDQQRVKSDFTFWCTQAKGASWLIDTKLPLSPQGFIRVKSTLQSVEFDDVFAAGDVCHFESSPLPKAGVYAVRMAKTLFANIRNSILEKPLGNYNPQGDFLSLLACGNKYALGARSGLTISGRWVWQWKDRIDQKFMSMLQQLPTDMKEQTAKPLPKNLADQLSKESHKDISELAMRCGGCGAKVGVDVLQQALQSIETVNREEVILGLDSPDDAAIIEVPEGQQLVQTIDQFRTFIDDPYLFGQIAAEHAMSDCFAMGADPVSALASVTVNYSAEQSTINELEQLMAGATFALNRANCQLVGGHTAEGNQSSLGFNINGLIPKNNALTKTGVQSNQVLITTKALGTGVIFAADMRHQSEGLWVENAIHSMLRSNQRASHILFQKKISACTDVTGFGLLGHLVEMLRGSDLGAEINLSSLPVLDGALTLFEQGHSSSLHPHNVRLKRAISNQSQHAHHLTYPVIFDPQTSGGLLASINENDADEVIQQLKEAGYQDTAIIGRITELPTQGVITLLN